MSDGKPAGQTSGLLAPLLLGAVAVAVVAGFWFIDPLGLRPAPKVATPEQAVAEQLANGAIKLGEPVAAEQAQAGLTRPPPPDLEASAETLARHREACSGGSADDCYFGGRQLEIGLGVERDEAQAAELYDRGCELGAAPACSSAGAMIVRRTEGGEAMLRASAYFRRACKRGETASCS